MSVENTGSDAKQYDIFAIQEKWLQRWQELRLFEVSNSSDAAKTKYVLDMFPYPSGDLHMGHAEAFAFGDIVARFWRGQGYKVLHPIGWDSFGLPAENAAIKRGVNPKDWTYNNIAQQKESFVQYATSFDWGRVIHTSDPEYYKWNQWLFLKMYEKGLAYRKASWVNWDPVDQTVLANEQVLPDGTSERSGAVVVKKKLTQWYFRITDYAERLLNDLDRLEGNWPTKVITMQRNWIGKSEGAEVDFEIDGLGRKVSVFTTRPDTLYGVTFMVVAPDSDLAAEIVKNASADIQQSFSEYLTEVQKLSDVDRQSVEREKTGVFLGSYAVNPISGVKIPVWSSDYVLADYGHGAIMAVPAHDQRDLDFALKFDLPVVQVLREPDADEAENGGSDAHPTDTSKAYTGEGLLINSGELNGLRKTEAIAKAVEILENLGVGRPKVNYRLRDWLISRQRYWGTPIPVLHDDEGNIVPVDYASLPVVLPDSDGLDLKPKGSSPLGAATEWANVTDSDGKVWRRDPDTMDTFVDSSWYFLRFLSPNSTEYPFDSAAAKAFGPVDYYVGGVEHAILHLLYARFITKVLFDLGYLDFDEPFTSLVNQGMVLLDGSKMSKSKGNLVEFASELSEHGADALRVALSFAGPPEEDIDWADVSLPGIQKFLARAWRVAGDVSSDVGVDFTLGDRKQRQFNHSVLADIIDLVKTTKFNVVVARLMELTNVLRKAIDSGVGSSDPAVREGAEILALALNLFAPFTAEDMWQLLGYEPSVALHVWPKPDPALLVADSVVAVVQVNGKVRERLEVSPSISESDLEALAFDNANIQAIVAGGTVVKVIVRAPKIVNIVLK